jgi:RHS repeat-associated protein
VPQPQGTNPAPGSAEPRSRPPDGSSISLPKGGGAIRGIGEKFSANPATGTGAMTIPVATSPDRAQIGPELSLGYDSGSGNSVFGFGWSLSLPSITRKTDLGLPLYRDHEESDVFLLSGAEDLVPVLGPDGAVTDRTDHDPAYLVRRYRPRVDGLFARIERWTRQQDGDVHWRTISADNLLTVYGLDPTARIADPRDGGRVFSWLISETRDDAGNVVRYGYRPDNGAGAGLSRASERNRGERDDPRRAVNRYLKRIEYGNRRPLLDARGRRPRFLADLPPAQVADAGFMFEIVLDYGEHDLDDPAPQEQGEWAFREDPFSSYRSGFEVRTTRLCRRFLTFHHVPDAKAQPGYDGLVRSTDLTYSSSRAGLADTRYSLLRSATQTGYRPVPGGYQRRSLPPVEFEYSGSFGPQAVQDVDQVALRTVPAGPAGYQWVDLRGEGIPGILAEQAEAWFYTRNLSPAGPGGVTFAPPELVAARPSLGLDGGRAGFLDLAGDGQPDLVVPDGPVPGFFEHDPDDGWQPFRPFRSRLERDLSADEVRLVDLDGDGRADVLVIEDDAFSWHQSLAEAGFGPARRVNQGFDEELGPRLVFTDGTQSVYLADLSGDGLADLARIRNGEICYWPNLGYGRFGAKVTMDGLRPLDEPGQFDQRRVRLADIDGTGTADLIYLHREGVRLYFNQSGNGWSDPVPLQAFPHLDDTVSVEVADLLGNGTSCLVWSSPLPGDAERRMRYVPLAGDKPHLLTRIVNNLGLETVVRYAPSTRFSLQDERDGDPWTTRLPFPVHVVDRVETRDRISRNRFVTRYAYHHGYFDGEEREFRGFALVDQWDTEDVGALAGQPDAGPPAANEDPASTLPPVHTRTWFHTGGLPGSGSLPDAGLPAPAPPDGLTAGEQREACRALKGSPLRQEVYALDGGPREPFPYHVTEHSFAVRLEQHRGAARHAVFSVHSAETLERHYERDPADPREQHSITLQVDSYGNVLKAVTIGYGRRQPSPLPYPDDRDRQAGPLLTYAEKTLTDPVDDPSAWPDNYRAPRPAESRLFELTGYSPGGQDGRYTAADFVTASAGPGGPQQAVFDAEIGYEQPPPAGRVRRLVEWTRALYRADDLSALLPLYRLEPRALPGESYALALTVGLIGQVFLRDGEPLLADQAAVLAGPGGDRGGYVSGQQLTADQRFPATDPHPEDCWWLPSGRVYLSPGTGDTAADELRYAETHFFLPCRTRDPFHSEQASTEGLIRYDEHDLLVAQTRDAAGNQVTAVLDYRTLQPAQVTDVNGNRTQVAFDSLGHVVATAVMGKPGDNQGDSLDGLDPDLTDEQLAAFLESPLAAPGTLLGRATTRLVYDLAGYQRTAGPQPAGQPGPQPAVVCTLAREVHDADLPAGAPVPVQLSFSYSDGLGRVIQDKLRAEAGPVAGGPVADPRWVGSGWTVFNNKGLPVREFEPFFTATHRFEFGAQAGVSPVVFYDPLGRAVATLNPDHSYVKVVFGPWQQATWDPNDTVLDDPRTDPDVAGFTAAYFAALPGVADWRTWHAERAGGDLGPLEQDAAAKAAAHASTPAVTHADVLGRPFLAAADNGPDPGRPGQHLLLTTRTELDIQGQPLAVLDSIGPDGDGAGRTVMRYRYDLTGNQIHRNGLDSGARWLITDVLGQPLRGWDQRGHAFRTEYDPLRRPLRSFVLSPGDASAAEVLTERLVYGEQHPQAAELNLRGVVYLQLDQAGSVETEALDFKGNPLRTSRRLASGTSYRAALDWRAVEAALPPAATAAFDPATLEAALVPWLEADGYTAAASYDALDRPVTMTSPHTPAMAASVVRPGYNEAGLLERLDVNLRGELAGGQPAWTPFVAGLDYDAQGRRLRIDYGNGASTSCTYDPRSLRLTRMTTTRPAVAFPDDSAQPMGWPGRQVQDLRYIYDPAGHVVQVRDDAQQRIFFANQRVEPSAGYRYDALYRLIEATGREHLGQNGGPIPPSPDDALRTRLPHPGDGAAMGSYTERYRYDVAGNILQVQHAASGAVPGWTCGYEYAEPGPFPGPGSLMSNRLTSTALGQDPATPTQRYSYDAHGNLTRLPHLSDPGSGPNMFWDHVDQLQRIDRGAGGTVYYVYDADGARVRKIWEKPGGLTEERVYLGGFEIYRRSQGADVLERETLHVMDGDQRIALVETRTRDTAGTDSGSAQLTRYQFGNQLGSACLELDDHARIISYEEYTPYGSTSYQAVAGQTETPKRYRFTGRERDEESGLNYHGARYYVPWLGRWASCDPLGLADGLNGYAYAHDDPIGTVDLTGTEGTPVITPILTPSGQPTGLAWVDFDEARPGSVPKASLSGSSSIPSKAAKPPAQRPARPVKAAAKPAVKPAAEPAPSAPPAAPTPPEPGPPVPDPAPAADQAQDPGIPATREFEPAVSDPEALRQAEGMGHIELGDLAQFAKGLWNGPASWVGARQFAVDEHYAGAALIGEELGKNLVFEAATAGVGKALDAATPFLRRAVRAPVFMFLGAGGTGGASLEAGRVLETAAEGTSATASTASAAAAGPPPRNFVPLTNIFPVDYMATRRGFAEAPKIGKYRGVTQAMREETKRLWAIYGPGGKVDVAHRTPLSQTPPGARVRLMPQQASANRAEGSLIARINAWRRKIGLYTR